MILNDSAVVLRRGDSGEFGRWAVLLTEEHGLLPVRFTGINRPAGKLKAFCEPMVWAEYRLCFSLRSSAVHVVGGRLNSTFPGLRADLPRTLTGLSLCEIAARLCAERASSPAKYRLLCRALSLLEQAPHPWLETAFGLRLLEAAGYGLRELPLPPAQAPLWRALHEAPLEGLGGLPWQEAAGRRFLQLVYEHVEAHAERPLRCREVARRMESFAAGLSRSKESMTC